MIKLTEEQEKVLKDAVPNIGPKRLWDAVEEENAEAIQAIVKMRRPYTDLIKIIANEENLYEETVDCFMMIVCASQLLDQERLTKMLAKKIAKFSKAVYE